MLGALGMLVGGLLVLAVAADQFVIGAARSARHLRVPLVAVGVVVVGFGTSLPEMVVSALAAGRGEIAVGVGNVIGSNLANLTLLLGVAALLSPLAVTSGVVRRELPLVAATTLLLAVVVQGRLAAWEGTLLLATMLLTTAWLLRSALRGRDDVVADETDEFLAPPRPGGAPRRRAPSSGCSGPSRVRRSCSRGPSTSPSGSTSRPGSSARPSSRSGRRCPSS